MTIETLLSSLKGVKAQGQGYTCQCPAHDDNRNSLSITEDGGKILLHCHAGCMTENICDALGITVKDLFNEPLPDTKPIITHTYDYTEPDGSVRYQVLRFKPKDFRQRRPDPEHPKQWIYNLKNIKPTIYNLPAVIKASQRGGTVFIVEGEKDVETLCALKLTATCNSGGAGKFPSSCAAYFSGCGVCIIPDNDEPGRVHAEKVAVLLSKASREIRVLNLPGLNEHGDVTDWLKTHSKEELLTTIKACEPWTPKPTTQPEPVKPKPHEPSSVPFRFLGYNAGTHYYLPGEDLQITTLTASAHTQSNLINLAPLSWWESGFGNKRGTDWNSAADFMFRNSKKQGIYDSRNLRGCGTWFDEGRVVQHNGDHLIVDGETTSIEAFKTRYIYNASYPIEVINAEPLGNTETAKFLALCRKPTWDKSISGTLMAGWCVIAPICGALPWRPHIWLTGASGTGKTYLTDQIIKPILGSLALNVQSNTTEAGIRQMLGINAFPVVFDEAEGEDIHARKRLQTVIELMRQASNEAGAPIIKGGQSGHAIEFRVRSCFALSSIGVNISQKADASRITILSLKKPDPYDVVDFFDDLKTDLYALITSDFPSRLRSRTLKLIPVILSNISIFSRVVAEKFTDQRIGDQFGALLAGAYSLVSNKNISYETALKFIAEQDWSEQSAVDDLPDEQKCLNKIMEHVINYSFNNYKIEKGIGEIIYNSIKEGLLIEAENALERIGIRVIDNSKIVISDSHKGIKRILFNEPWEQNWGRILKRLPETDVKTSFRFNGNPQRATQIPLKIVFRNEE